METDNAVVVAGDKQYPMTAMGVVAQVRLIQEVMAAVMKKDTHFGVIPGCAKPSLWKPGAEKLLSTFRIASEAIVEDLSGPDEARYRVTRRGLSTSGAFVGSGVGECSSNEEKYKWRGIACDAEFDATPEDRRRLKYKRDGSTIKQIRTNPADVANTVLKMADKRGYVALALNVTAASDCFSQDIEDLPDEVRESILEGQAPKPTIKEPEAKAKPKAAGDILVTEVKKLKEGTSSKGAWTMWKVKFSDGIEAITFDSGNAATADTACGQNTPVVRDIKKTEKGHDLVSIDYANVDAEVSA